MTRSVTIVNTSNWEHEDVEVVVTGTDPEKVGERAVLKPGDFVTAGPYTKGQEVNVRMVGVEPQEPQPFRDADGNQDCPRVEVHKPKPSAEG